MLLGRLCYVVAMMPVDQMPRIYKRSINAEDVVISKESLLSFVLGAQTKPIEKKNPARA